MQKISGITAYWFLWIMALSSYTIAANSDVQPITRGSVNQIKEIHSKIIYFDSLAIEDSLDHYVNMGFHKFKHFNLNEIESKSTQLELAKIFYEYGEINFDTNETFESIVGYEKAAEIFKKYNIQGKYADCLTANATNYSKVGSEPESLKLMNEATSIYIDLKDSVGMMTGYRSIGLLYKRQKDFVRAHEYFNKALSVSKGSKDLDGTIHLLLPIAFIHKQNGEYDKALSFYLEALSLSKTNNDEMTEASVYSNLGEFYKNTGELDSAKFYIDKARVIIERNDSDYKKSYLWLNYSDYYFLKKDYEQAILYGEKALELSEQIKNSRAEYITLNILVKIYNELGDTDKIAEYQKRIIAHLFEHKDQLNKQINELETVRFKLDKQTILAENEQGKMQLQLEKENQRRNYIYIFASSMFALLLTFSFIVYLRLRTTRVYNKKILQQSEERKMLLQEVHHRVKNNFQIVSSMLRLQSYGFENEILRQNFDEAVTRINAMAIVHNVIYRQEKFSEIDAKNYLEKLVESIHKSGNNKIDITIDSEEIPFKIETLINLGIALNELITNSFKHAFNEEITDPKIKISLRKVGEKSFELIYRDNGIGYNQEEFKSNFGMELIETIITNFDGEVSYLAEEEWNTVIKIAFSE
ncbi:tetratricopeptide repeat-containing sensor histidine kinase [Brumimicrobium oceani]|nr:histidine kinase dimerization/phosphoacceptor domain -containing protein [Brumimicrobium oceani]